MSVFISVFLSVSLSFAFSLFLPVSLYVSLCLFLCLYLSRPFCLSVCLSLYPCRINHSVSLYVFRCLSLNVKKSLYVCRVGSFHNINTYYHISYLIDNVRSSVYNSIVTEHDLIKSTFYTEKGEYLITTQPRSYTSKS